MTAHDSGSDTKASSATAGVADILVDSLPVQQVEKKRKKS
jgi:hypothetical protein